MMHTGTLIDDLTASVERAEKHATELQMQRFLADVPERDVDDAAAEEREA